MRKHSVLIEGHATSFSLEDAFFIQLKTIAGNRSSSLTSLIAEIDAARPQGQNLSSSIRVFVLEELQRELAGGRTTPSSGEQIP